ncbi:thioredoxin [Acidovorax sp. Leaf78]|uniref:thioredoxin n=1 Tax=Acidovorax sp. Leaf78 TaxID=1736237 RepID=UPI0012E25FBC|nr:thioredoxin [Acidovorax sp. Leaf78]
MRLDPWSDAQTLAQRLAQPGAQLIVVIGAVAWCQKCRDYLPIFDQQAMRSSPNQNYVWLDVEEHAAFLGAYVPHDLPLRLQYEDGQLSTIKDPQGNSSFENNEIPAAQIYQRLTAEDWA